MCGAIEYGKCEICGKEAPLERTYFYYNIPCECCGCKIDDKNMHFELVCHCEKCAPDIPLQIRPSIKSKIDGRPYRQTIKRMLPYDIRGQFCIQKFKIEKQN